MNGANAIAYHGATYVHMVVEVYRTTHIYVCGSCIYMPIYIHTTRMPCSLGRQLSKHDFGSEKVTGIRVVVWRQAAAINGYQTTGGAARAFSAF